MRLFFLKILYEIPIWIDFVVSYIPGYTGRALRKLLLKKKVGLSGKNINLDIGVEILGGKNISMGKNISIMRFSSLHAQDDAILKLGNDISINSNTCISADQGEVIIGNHVLIAQNVVIRASNHKFTDTSLPMAKQGHSGGKIVIGSDCWIGANAVIISNVTIGNGCIVGAGAVVTKNIAPFSIVGGVPAKLLRSRGLSG